MKKFYNEDQKKPDYYTEQPKQEYFEQPLLPPAPKGKRYVVVKRLEQVPVTQYVETQVQVPITKYTTREIEVPQTRFREVEYENEKGVKTIEMVPEQVMTRHTIEEPFTVMEWQTVQEAVTTYI